MEQKELIKEYGKLKEQLSDHTYTGLGIAFVGSGIFYTIGWYFNRFDFDWWVYFISVVGALVLYFRLKERKLWKQRVEEIEKELEIDGGNKMKKKKRRDDDDGEISHNDTDDDSDNDQDDGGDNGGD